jgi:branched-chain amino acid transport system substrate-binding protein
MGADNLRNILAAALALGLAAAPALAQKTYDPGASDTEIKIGNIMPYSGPASAYAVIGKTEAAYFAMINAQGGINGRKVTFLSYDDGYSPPKAVEQARRLVENDHVLLIFQSLGTPSNSAIHAYMNQKHVPQLFPATGATKWADPEHFPWTMGWQPNYQSEGHIYAKYLLEHRPDAKIAVLYQNDDYGKDVLKGVMDGLGDKAKAMVVAQASYEVTDPTVDPQILQLEGSKADVFINIATPKFAAQAIKKVAETGWKPLHILNNVAASVGGVLKPAGLDNAKGVVSTAYFKEPTDPQWQNGKDFKDWAAFMDKYYADGDKTNAFTVYGYIVSELMVRVLKQCGDDLTRANVMKQAANLHEVALPMLLPGIKANTSPTDFSPVKQMQMERFDGKTWQLFGPVMNGGAAS